MMHISVIIIKMLTDTVYNFIIKVVHDVHVYLHSIPCPKKKITVYNSCLRASIFMMNVKMINKKINQYEGSPLLLIMKDSTFVAN